MSTRRTSTGDAPLVAWEHALRTVRHHARIRRIAAGLAVGGVFLGATIVCPPAPRLVWNTSPSVPIGLYRVNPGAPARVGDMVLAQVPASWRALAAGRRYIPANVPLVKRVVAAAGATVCARGASVLVDGKPVAARLARDPHGRNLPWWSGCVRLTGRQLLLLTPASDSFDGRYFGVTDGADVIGRAVLLWRR